MIYFILSYLGSDYFILMGGGGGEEDFPQKNQDQIFPEKYMQDRVNSTVHFAFFQIKRQNRVVGERTRGPMVL